MYYSIAIPINDFNINNVIIKDHTVNKIIPDSTFCKLMYSTSDCHISGIPLCVNLFEFNTSTKYKFVIHKEKSKNAIELLQRTEECILHLYSKNIYKKKPIYKLSNQLIRGIIKLNNESYNSNQFIIKIIGIWESNKEYGLTYRLTNHR
jgi:hypothetical protein